MIDSRHRRRLLAIGAGGTIVQVAQAWSQTRARRVVFLGTIEAALDSTFASMREALLRLDATRTAALQLEHLLLADHRSNEDKGALIAQAFMDGCDVLIAPTASVARLAADALRRSKRATVAAVVFASFDDPVAAGIVPSMRNPGVRVTGISLTDTWHAKRFELLRAAFGRVRMVGVLMDRAWGAQEIYQAEIGLAATAFGLQTSRFDAETKEELNQVMHSARAARMDAWYVVDSYISWLAEQQIIDHLKRLQRPAMHTTVNEVAKGGALMAYAADRSFVYLGLADLTLRILAGEDPGTIPIQRPRRFVLAVRPRAEPAALRIHPSVVRRADRVY